MQIHVQSTGLDLTQTVSRFESKVETATRTMNVEVDVTNADLTITPGMYATATVEVERHNQALAVPIAAVARKEDATVFVVTPQNKIEKRTVETGLETPTLIEITRGLRDGERVMLGSRGHVQPGQQVTPKIIAEENSP